MKNMKEQIGKGNRTKGNRMEKMRNGVEGGKEDNMTGVEERR